MSSALEISILGHLFKRYRFIRFNSFKTIKIEAYNYGIFKWVGFDGI